MARWYEVRRFDKEHWKILSVQCSNCGHTATQISDTCPSCGETCEAPPYMMNGNGCVIDRATMPRDELEAMMMRSTPQVREFSMGPPPCG